MRETDAAGNYTWHYFYTTGSDYAERLTGKEYQTQSYDGANTLLKQDNFDWGSRAIYTPPPYYVSTASWGSQGTGPGQFNSPVGIAVGNDGYIYVTDLGNHRIQKFTSSGTYVTGWGSYGTGGGQFNYPYSIAIGANGYIYVADSLNNRIQMFTTDGYYAGQWSGVNRPYGVTVGNDGYVYVSDTSYYYDFNGYCTCFYGGCCCVYPIVRVQKFGPWGSLVSSWLTTPESYTGDYASSALAVGSDGSVYVVDVGANVVRKHTNSGSLVTQWGGFNTPWGIAVGNDSSVYVANLGSSQIKKFTSAGGFVTQWGVYGSGVGQLNYPYGVAVGSDGSVYVDDTSTM